MSQVAFLLDEHLPLALVNAILATEPTVDVTCVGQPGGPPKQTPDPVMIEVAEREGRAIVTFDKKTMPGHAAAHVASGRHTFGVFVFTDDHVSPGRMAHELLLIWSAVKRRSGLTVSSTFPGNRQHVAST